MKSLRGTLMLAGLGLTLALFAGTAAAGDRYDRGDRDGGRRGYTQSDRGHGDYNRHGDRDGGRRGGYYYRPVYEYRRPVYGYRPVYVERPVVVEYYTPPCETYVYRPVYRPAFSFGFFFGR